MIPVIIIFIGIVLIAVMIRVMIIRAIVDDWNYYLHELIEEYRLNQVHSFNVLQYYEQRYIKPSKYYFKLRIWNVKEMVDEPLIYDAVQNSITDKYFKE